ncbi:MAG: phenylacetate--CoA ligase family protein [Verrucomicrobia bacterium]|nr:phenylacetate--CoA ligase family protein [Verrucomicrobiota bacterium]
MPPTGPFLKRHTLIGQQIDRIRGLLNTIIGANPFNTQKLETADMSYKIRDLTEFADLAPYTTLQEITDDQRANPPYGTNLTFLLPRYIRCHHEAGAGARFRWLDTEESWDTMLLHWAEVFQTAGVTLDDGVFFAPSMQPALDGWLALESAARLGCLCLPGTGLDDRACVQMMAELGATVLCCSAGDAARLAELAAQEKLEAVAATVRLVLLGARGAGTAPAERESLARLWPNARVCEHWTLTEAGVVAFECPARLGVWHIFEDAILPEVLDPATRQAVEPGQSGELVLTTFFRTGSPLLRYRTGCLVKTAADSPCECGRYELALEGGILGRVG